MITGSIMVAIVIAISWFGLLCVWACLARANDERPSPEKPAGVPPRDAVFILPTGETWNIAESNEGGAS